MPVCMCMYLCLPNTTTSYLTLHTNECESVVPTAWYARTRTRTHAKASTRTDRQCHLPRKSISIRYRQSLCPSLIISTAVMLSLVPCYPNHIPLGSPRVFPIKVPTPTFRTCSSVQLLDNFTCLGVAVTVTVATVTAKSVAVIAISIETV